MDKYSSKVPIQYYLPSYDNFFYGGNSLCSSSTTEELWLDVSFWYVVFTMCNEF